MEEVETSEAKVTEEPEVEALETPVVEEATEAPQVEVSEAPESEAAVELQKEEASEPPVVEEATEAPQVEVSERSESEESVELQKEEVSETPVVETATEASKAEVPERPESEESVELRKEEVSEIPVVEVATEAPQMEVSETPTPVVEPEAGVLESPVSEAVEVLEGFETPAVDPEAIAAEALKSTNIPDEQDVTIQESQAKSDDGGFGHATEVEKSVAITESFATNPDKVERPNHPYLIREKTKEQVLINQPLFRIGKEPSYCQYIVTDNNAVSRNHADIVSKNGGYFIIDNKSTNGTFVNDQLIPVHTEVKILSGVKLTLADEDFIFYI